MFLMRMGEAAVGATRSHNAAVPAQQDRLVFGELQCKEGIMYMLLHSFSVRRECCTEYGGDHSRI